MHSGLGPSLSLRSSDSCFSHAFWHLFAQTGETFLSHAPLLISQSAQLKRIFAAHVKCFDPWDITTWIFQWLLKGWGCGSFWSNVPLKLPSVTCSLIWEIFTVMGWPNFLSEAEHGHKAYPIYIQQLCLEGKKCSRPPPPPPTTITWISHSLKLPHSSCILQLWMLPPALSVLTV